MKCAKCGMELGQKNICPVCGKEKPADDQAAPKIAPQVSSGFSKEELEKIDEFVKAHPSDWNDEFDDFYEKQVFAANYRDTVSVCRHRAEIFAAVREMLKDAQKLSADLMIRIMDEIPEKYPEIDDNTARALAREFFGARKQIRQLTLKDTALGVADLALTKICRELKLSWKHIANDHVNVDDTLCDMRLSDIEPAVLSIIGPVLGYAGSIIGNKFFIVPVKSPLRGRIVSIRTEPVTKLDDVICEIETAD